MTYITKHITPHVAVSDVMLDLCCGVCAPTRGIVAAVKIGVDLCEKSLEVAKQFCLPIKADASKVGDMFLPGFFDVVLWLDGIEHLEFTQAMHTLGAIQKLAKKKVIVFTPNQKTCFDEPNELMRHKSFFPEKFWRDLGWDVTTGFKSTSSTGEVVEMILAVKEIK